MICKTCGVSMVRIYRFSPKREGELYACPKCHGETPLRRINYDNIKVMQENHENAKDENIKKGGRKDVRSLHNNNKRNSQAFKRR